MKKFICILLMASACISVGAQTRADSLVRESKAAVQQAQRDSRQQSRDSRRDINRSQDQIKQA